MKKRTESKLSDETSKSIEKKKKIPYTPPAIEEETSFESLAMGCNGAAGNPMCSIPQSS